MKRKLRNPAYFLRRTIVGTAERTYLRFRMGEPAELVRISLCTVVMNRFDHLRRTLPDNIRAAEDYENAEFVLLDYSCPDPRTRQWVQAELGDLIASGRLVYGFYPDAGHFTHSHSRNLAFRLSSGDVFCNVDADHLIGRGFASYLDAVMREGHCCIQGPGDGRGLGGRVAVRREDFEAVGGYDEAFSSYGFEDMDLVSRISMNGVPRRTIWQERFLRSIRHDHASRTANFEITDFEAAMAQSRAIFEENRSLGRVCPNGPRFGLGRVERNFEEWVELTA